MPGQTSRPPYGYALVISIYIESGLIAEDLTPSVNLTQAAHQKPRKISTLAINWGSEVVGTGHISADEDEVEVLRLLSGTAAAAAEIGPGNRDSICVVSFIEDAEGKRFA
ncbi:hypothetical protein TNCV_3379911 [Trichonephila clavipes]|nr:hypothetical protein TNCV_3379911 [Trichonephila clavipes]